MASSGTTARRASSKASVAPAPPPVDRREALLQALEAIYLAEGFRRTTVGELAARLHCSKRALYELAPSKEALFLLVFDRCLNDIWSRGLEAERAHDDLRERIRWYVESALVPLRHWSRAFLADVASLPEARRLLEQHLVDRMARLQGMVQAGVRSGLFRRFNPHLVAEMIQVAAARCCEPDFLERSKLPLDTAIEQMCAILWDGLMRPPEARP